MQEDVDLKANVMNPNNNAFWASRGLIRPTDLQEALAQGHAILEREGHRTHMQQIQPPRGVGNNNKWARRASLEPTHNPPMFGQWPAFVSTPGAWMMPPSMAPAPPQHTFSREWPPFVVNPYKERRPPPPPGLELFGQQFPPFAPFVPPQPPPTMPGFEGVVWEEDDETLPVPEQSELTPAEAKTNAGLVEISVSSDKEARLADLDREIDTNLAQELSQVELQPTTTTTKGKAEAREERASSQAAQQ